jgi:DnaJ-class molecular chaperone
MVGKCPYCDGTGYIKQDSFGTSGYTLFQCKHCGGSGHNLEKNPPSSTTLRIGSQKEMKE